VIQFGDEPLMGLARFGLSVLRRFRSTFVFLPIATWLTGIPRRTLKGRLFCTPGVPHAVGCQPTTYGWSRHQYTSGVGVGHRSAPTHPSSYQRRRLAFSSHPPGLLQVSRERVAGFFKPANPRASHRETSKTQPYPILSGMSGLR
jgi:hypothetical protein